MVHIAICDDDEGFRQSLSDTINTHLTSAFIIFQFSDGAELLRCLEQRQRVFDLILLDIRMPQMDGLKTARRIREMDKGTVIIFITNYGECVYDGYDVQAFHFFTKPLDESRFLPILSCAVKRVEEIRTEYLVINKQSECVYIPLREILYIESQSRMLNIHTDHETLEYYEKLEVLSDRLIPKGFCRIHRCYLVNMDAVRYVDKHGLWVRLRNGRKLDVSRRRLSGLLCAMQGSQ